MPQAQVATGLATKEERATGSPRSFELLALRQAWATGSSRRAGSETGTLIPFQQLCSRSRPAPSPYLPSSPVCPRVKVSAKHATGGGHGAEVSGA